VKLVYISNSPVPYTTPILNALAGQLDLHVIYMSREDVINRYADMWGVEPDYDYSMFWSKTLQSEAIGLQTHFSMGVSRRLAKLRPDVVLVVSWKPQAIEPLVWTRTFRRASVMWSESTQFSGMLRGAFSNQIRRGIFRMIDGYVTNGTQATAFLHSLGVPAERIVTSTLPTGATNVDPLAERPRHDDEGVRFLYVGRLIPQKRPLELIDAFRTVRREVPASTLTIVGKGKLEGGVRAAALAASGVHYAGYCEGSELASQYARADVLVLPALREVWGLVVNEALAHGLFVITSDEVGSAYDLLGDGSGTMVPAHDFGRLAPAMIDAARTVDFSDGARIVRASTVAECTPERFARDIYKAASAAMQRRASAADSSRP
jgi:glycosyltransferase involved in cell wall biosynthesis